MCTSVPNETIRAESDISKLRRIAYEAGIEVNPPAVYDPVRFRNWLFTVLTLRLHSLQEEGIR